jgi:hypothetical protein
MKPWTPEYLAFVLPLRPDDIMVSNNVHGFTLESRREWAWIDYAQRLTFQYGPEEALKRLNAAPVSEMAVAA